MLFSFSESVQTIKKWVGRTQLKSEQIRDGSQSTNMGRSYTVKEIGWIGNY